MMIALQRCRLLRAAHCLVFSLWLLNGTLASQADSAEFGYATVVRFCENRWWIRLQNAYTKLSMDDAQSYCREQGGELATVSAHSNWQKCFADQIDYSVKKRRDRFWLMAGLEIDACFNLYRYDTDDSGNKHCLIIWTKNLQNCRYVQHCQTCQALNVTENAPWKKGFPKFQDKRWPSANCLSPSGSPCDSRRQCVLMDHNGYLRTYDCKEATVNDPEKTWFTDSVRLDFICVGDERLYENHRRVRIKYGPDKSLKGHEFVGKCSGTQYRFWEKKMTWFKAIKFCHMQNMKMALPHSPTELACIAQLAYGQNFTDSYPVWLGLNTQKSYPLLPTPIDSLGYAADIPAFLKWKIDRSTGMPQGLYASACGLLAQAFDRSGKNLPNDYMTISHCYGVVNYVVCQSDEDECALKKHNCPPHAQCVNQFGKASSYMCVLPNVTFDVNGGKVSIGYYLPSKKNTKWSEVCASSFSWQEGRVLCGQMGYYDLVKVGSVSMKSRTNMVDVSCLGHENSLGYCTIKKRTNPCPAWASATVLCDHDECALRTHNCHKDAICMNTIGSYSCKCKPGYEGHGNECRQSVCVARKQEHIAGCWDNPKSRALLCVSEDFACDGVSDCIEANEEKLPYCKVKGPCTTASHPDFSLRLVGNTFAMGHLEILFGRQWGVVAMSKSTWTDQNTDVACRHLGFVYGRRKPSTVTFEDKPANSPFFLQQLKCKGSENNLTQCESLKIGQLTSIKGDNKAGLITCESCRKHEFLCKDHHCIPSQWQCDGEMDCADGSDELNCLSRYSGLQCDIRQFSCPSGVSCFGSSQPCHGKLEGCNGNYSIWPSFCTNSKLLRCAAKEFLCDSGHCVADKSKCNGVNDCGDKSDESLQLCTQDCPQGWLKVGRKCLKKIDTLRSAQSARRHCVASAGQSDVAAPMSVAENVALQTLLSGQQAWIGSLLKSSGGWRWRNISSGPAADKFINLENGNLSKSSQSEICLAVQPGSGKWRSVKCSSPLPYICEVDTVCVTEPCVTGMCVPTGRTYQCNCPKGYYGLNCQIHQYSDDHSETGTWSKCVSTYEYMYVSQKLTWSKAKDHCKSLQGVLAVPHSKSQNLCIYQAARNWTTTQYTWLGVTIHKDGVFGADLVSVNVPEGSKSSWITNLGNTPSCVFMESNISRQIFKSSPRWGQMQLQDCNKVLLPFVCQRIKEWQECGSFLYSADPYAAATCAEASASCGQHRAYLATPHSAEENKCLFNAAKHFKLSGKIWLGIKRDSNGNYYGLDGGKLFLNKKFWKSQLKVTGALVTMANVEGAGNNLYQYQDVAPGSKEKLPFVCQRLLWTPCGTKKYAYVSAYVECSAARTWCAQNGGYLAIPRSPKENDCVFNTKARFTMYHVWLGATYSEQGHFIGTDGKQVSTKSKFWSSGYPSTLANGACAYMYNMALDNSPGNNGKLWRNYLGSRGHLPFVCQQGCGMYTCKNGASCVKSGNKEKCQCTAGFTGQHCEIPLVRISPASVHRLRYFVEEGKLRMGHLEVFQKGTWGTMCDRNWTLADATVACRQLGFPKALRASTGGEFSSWASQKPIHLSSVDCNGTEASILECPLSLQAISQCSHRHDVGIVCASSSACLPGWLELEGKCFGLFGTKQEARQSYAGAVDACSKIPGTSLADVHIRSPALLLSWMTSQGASYARIGSKQAQNGGTHATVVNKPPSECLLLRMLSMGPTDGSVNSCTTPEPYLCQRATSQLEKAEVRLKQKQNESSGLVEIRFGKSGKWQMVYDASFSFSNVICKQLGYKGIVSYSMRATSHTSNRALLFHSACEGIEHSLSECELIYLGQKAAKQALWLTCTNSLEEEGTLRLSSKNSSESGLLEIFFKKMWRPVLASRPGPGQHFFTVIEGDVACKKLGFKNVKATTAVSVANYKDKESDSAYAFWCTGKESGLADCTVRKSSSVGYFAHITCSNTVSPSLARFSLSGLHLSAQADSGIVEMQVNGIWALVDAARNDAQNLLCAALGYERSFSSGTQSVQLQDVATHPMLDSQLMEQVSVTVDCNGGKKNLSECSTVLSHPNTSRRQLAVVRCALTRKRPSFLNITVPKSGHVEQISIGSQVYSQQKFFLCGDSWSMGVADVVCKHSGKEDVATNLGNYYTVAANMTAKRVVSVACTGKEVSLLECQLSFGKCVTSNFFRQIVCERKKETLPEVTARTGAHNIVELFIKDRWYSVCGSWENQFDNVDTLCKQMKQGGAARGSSWSLLSKVPSNATDDILSVSPPVVTQVKCGYQYHSSSVGPVPTVQQCQRSGTKHPLQCTTLATAFCNSDSSVDGKSWKSNYVKLNGTAVMVYRNTKWGYVCRDGWTTTEASIVCRMIGSKAGDDGSRRVCDTKAHICYSRSLPVDDIHHLLPSNRQLLVGGLHCSGNEPNLLGCRQHLSAGCKHGSKDVATAKCTSTWVDEEVRFVDKNRAKYFTTPSTGEVEIFYGYQYQAVCTSALSQIGADVICRQMGFLHAAGSFPSSLNSTVVEDWNGSPILTSIRCTNKDQKVQDCKIERTRGSCHREYLRCVSHRCPNHTPDSIWQEFNGTCYWLSKPDQLETYNDAKQRRCPGGSWLSVIAKDAEKMTLEERFVRDAILTAKLQLKDVWTLSSPVKMSNSKKRFICEAPVKKEIKHVHLVGGSNFGEGRLEVMLTDGSVGTVCNDGWSIQASHVVCHELGYVRAVSLPPSRTFPKGSGSIALDDVRCHGYETQLGHCHYRLHQHDCSHGEDVMVQCELGLRPQIQIGSKVIHPEENKEIKFASHPRKVVTLSCTNTHKIEWVFRRPHEDERQYRHNLIGFGEEYGLNATYMKPGDRLFTCREVARPDVSFTFRVSVYKSQRSCLLTECSLGGFCWRDKERESTTSCRMCDLKHYEKTKKWAPYVEKQCMVQGKFKKGCFSGCDDGNHCTKDDTCRGNFTCSGDPITCKPCEECFRGSCVVKRDRCLINNICYVKGQPNPEPGRSCQVCSPVNSVRLWTNRQKGTRCNDGDRCTRSDACNVDGQCVGVSYASECQHPCLECGMNDQCVPRNGFFCAKNGRCGCSINGMCYEEGAHNPSNFCEVCNANYGMNTRWSTVDGLNCDDKNECTYGDKCIKGTCTGKKFLCSLHKCVMKSVCKSTRTEGTCMNEYAPSTTMCYAQKDECDHPNTFCTGTRAVCPVNTTRQLFGRHVHAGDIHLVQPNGQALNEHFLPLFNKSMKVALQAQTSSVLATIKNWTVTCGSMSVKAAVYPVFSKEQALKPTSQPLLLKGQNGQRWLIKQLPRGNHDISLRLELDGLKHKGIYVLKVVGINIRNLTDSAISSPFFIDTTPPQLKGTISDVPNNPEKTMDDIQYSSDTSSMTVRWLQNAFADEESGISISHGTKSYAIGIGSKPNAHDIRDFQDCKINEGTVHNLYLQSGQTYYATVRVKNNAGLFAVGSSNGVLIDTTKPEVGPVTVSLPLGLINNLPVLSVETLTISAQIDSFQDKESGIKSVQWQLCYNEPSTRCSAASFMPLNCTDSPCVFDAVQAVDSGLTNVKGLVSGQWYQLEIMVTNKAGLNTWRRSPKFLVDVQKPNSKDAIVNDGSQFGADLEYATSTTTLECNWFGFVDPVGTIHHYFVEVVDKNGKTIAAADNVLRSPYRIDGLSLNDSLEYKMCVSAVDGANLTSKRVCSNGMKIDSQPPLAGEVRDLNPVGVKLDDVDYQMSMTSIRAKWNFKANSGMKKYEWSIGTQPGGTDVRQFSDVGQSTQSVASGLVLTAGMKYYTTVRATSVSGLTSTSSSDGVTADNTVPFAGKVNPVCSGTGCGVKVSCPSPACDTGHSSSKIYINTNTELGVQWSGFSDRESGIDHYALDYGYCSRKYDLLQPSERTRSESSVNQAVLTGLPLAQGATYCLTVYAFNQAGGFTRVRSTNGLTVDVTPPAHPNFILHDGRSLETDRDHQPYSDKLRAIWTPLSDSDSGMAFQEVSVGSTPGATDICKPVLLSPSTNNHMFNELNLKDLETYYFQVCGINNAGTRVCFQTDGVLVDTTAPTAGLVLTGHELKGRLFQSDSTSMAARWTGFEDRSSDVDYFSWGIGSNKNKTDVFPLTPVGLNTSATAEKLSLHSGQKYFITVQVVNRAGHSVKSQSQAITVDTTAPKQGEVSLSISPKGVADIAWSGFNDPESGIWYFKWSLGTTCPGNQAAGFVTITNETTSAIVNNATLFHGELYYARVVARNRAGQFSHVCSKAFRYDVTPPKASSLVTDSAASDMDYSSSLNTYTCFWSAFVDRESPLKSCTMEVIDEELSAAVYTSPVPLAMENSNLISHSATNIQFKDGRSYKCRISCTNTRDLTASAASDGFLVDLTPPVKGKIDVPSFWGQSKTFTARWKGFSDPESDMFAYVWSIGTSLQNSSDVLNETFVNHSITATTQDLELVHGEKYYVTVKAINMAGKSTSVTSRPFVVDLTGPVGEGVFDGPNGTDVDFSPRVKLAAHWNAFKDNESLIVNYRWAIGTQPGGCQVLEFTSVGIATSAKCSSCNTVPDQTYYVTVEAENSAGIKTRSSSNGMMIDETPPGRPFLKDFNSNQSIITAVCKGSSDGQSKVKQCVWLVKHTMSNVTLSGSIPCPCNGCAFAIPNPSREMKNATADDSPHAMYTLQATCSNHAGLQSSSKVMTLDVTPPRGGQIKCNEYCKALAITWTGLHDPQSDVHMLFSVGTAPGAGDILAPTTKYVNLTYGKARAPSILLQSNQTVYFTLAAKNMAGMVTTASCKMIVDLTPPAAGWVNDGLGPKDIDGLDPTHSVGLSANWGDFADYESHIRYYEWCVGNHPGGQELLKWTNVGNKTSAACSHCKLLAGERYYVAVRAVNRARAKTMVVSDGIILDWTGPTAKAVYDGDKYNEANAIPATSRAAVSWDRFTDSQSRVTSCDVELIDTKTSQVVWAKRNLPLTITSVSIDTPLPFGVVFLSKVTCINEVKLKSSNTSNGFVIDNTPPSAGNILCQRSNNEQNKTVIVAHVSGFNDPESLLATFDVSLQTGDGKMVLEKRSAGLNSTYTFAPLSLTTGRQYFVQVVAHNNAKLTTVVKSKVFYHDDTPPAGGPVKDGNTQNDINYQKSLTRISAHWENFVDKESSIAEYAYAIGTTPGGTQVQGYKSVGKATKVVSESRLRHAHKYYITVRAANGGDQAAWLSSDGFIVDITPPIGSKVYVGSINFKHNRYLSALGSVLCSWDKFTDQESPLISYRACAGTMQFDCSVAGWQPGSANNSATFNKLPVAHGDIIYVTVEGTNAAGLATNLSSAAVEIDQTPPSPGLVKDGLFFYDIDCQEDINPISAHWAGFKDKESGIVRYLWAVGSSQYTDNLLTWTDVTTATYASVNSTIITKTTDLVFISVKAHNGAGLSVMATSDGIRLLPTSANRGNPSGSDLSTLCVSFAGHPPASSTRKLPDKSS